MLLPSRIAMSVIRNTNNPGPFIEIRVWVNNKDIADPPDQITIVLPVRNATTLAAAILAIRDGGYFADTRPHDDKFNEIMRTLDMTIPPLEDSE